MDDRAAALAEIARLARDHQLTVNDIAEALGNRAPALSPVPDAAAAPPSGVLVRVLGFIGGIGGNLIHLLLAVALVVLILQLITGRRAVV